VIEHKYRGFSKKVVKMRLEEQTIKGEGGGGVPEKGALFPEGSLSQDLDKNPVEKTF